MFYRIAKSGQSVMYKITIHKSAGSQINGKLLPEKIYENGRKQQA